jgi:predicted ATPase/DNA-binding SARP family transcriptional activator
MWLGVLGPVRCAAAGRGIEVPGHLNRALLAALAVDRRRVTGVDELVDALWGASPPSAADKVVRNRVSLLRRVLGAACVDTAGAGYRLGGGVVVDLQQFEDVGLDGSARLALWRGHPFLEVAEWPPAHAAAVRLGELHAHLEEVAIADRLDAGSDASALVGLAEALVVDEPFRERRWALLMRTLYLAGRQHDALRAFRRARDLLREELGLTPGAELLAVEQAILHHEPSLAARGSPVTTSTPPRTRLFGRDDAAAAVREMLRGGRLVTLTGLGGVGKTSLAHQIARDWTGARWIVDLGTVDDPAGVAEAVARTLRIPAATSAQDAVATWSATAPPCLLVLDNCEHVRAAVLDVVDAVLAGGAGPSVLATSRIPLGGPHELIHRVQPLARADSVALYRARAARRSTVTGDDPTVERLCHALSDVPLAIELAAARSPILSPADMIRGLDAVTTTSTGSGVRAPQGSVVDVVAWAADALSPAARLLFRRCAVFPAGFTMDAARALTTGDLSADQLLEAFAELAEASLVQVTFQPATRYHYLDLVRRRAEADLAAADERLACECRVVRWAVAETASPAHDDLPRLLVELPNIVMAAGAACRLGDTDAALRITGASWRLIVAQRGELLDSTVDALHLPDAPRHELYAARSAELAMALFSARGDLVGARQFAEAALDVAPDSRAAGWAALTLGHLEGDPARLRRALELARRWRDAELQFYVSCMIVDNASQSGAEDAWDLVRETDELAASLQRPWARILATIVRGQAHCQLDPEAALVHLERAAEMADRCGLTAYAAIARAVAGLAGSSADPRARLALTRQGLVEASDAGMSYLTWLALARLARTLDELGHPDRAALFAGAARAHFRSTAETGTRLYQIDREDHAGHVTAFDIGATMEIGELLALLDTVMRELDPAVTSSAPSVGHGPSC